MELVLATAVVFVFVFVTLCIVAARNLWRMNYTRTWNINGDAKTPPSIHATGAT